jgi:mono/diheme cytochrome c family protein
MLRSPLPCRWFLGLPVALVLIFPAPARAADEPGAADVEFFEKRIRPLLVQHCYGCHSVEAKKTKGELLLDSRTGWQKGGASGPAVVPGKPAESLFIKAVRFEDPNLQMPPRGKLAAADIADLEAWVKRGAPDPRTGVAPTAPAVDLAKGKEFWSFQPVKDYPPPPVKDTVWPRSPVDHFVLAKLEEKGLRPAPPADRRTLIRRATYDLTGLPPTPEEMEAALSDKSPDWFEKVVDRLLASPHYGERWGRHWLDVVRYADTAGDNSDYPVPQMYRYRNWVIAAFNEDKPYDAFIREQLAGDLLAGSARSDAERENNLIATGYLANARRFGSYEDERYPWHLTIEDTIDNLGRTFLGLTINCCRCHDHKFDPLTNEDYYALYGFFSSTRYPWPGIELDKSPKGLTPLAPADVVRRFEQERAAKLAAMDKEIGRLECEKACAAQSLRDAEKGPKNPDSTAEIAELKKQIEGATKAIAAAKKDREVYAKKPLPFPTAYAVAEGKTEGKKKVGNACIQIKGDPERLGKEVARRFPTVLGGQSLAPDARGSGRLELARWIAANDNPLTARVMVNRIWQYHFGRGIVPTPSDFGNQGRPPTHPELLDYLARYFISTQATTPGSGGPWSIKKMHRLIMLSRTYQMASDNDPANLEIDVANDYLWRFARRRLDAESIRDTLLAVTGDLDRTTGGPHPFPEPTTWNFTQHHPFKAVYEANRRSVYLMTQRIQRHPFLGLFDGADTNASTAWRVTSTTPLQALYLMNDPFIHEQSRKFADRLLSERPDDPGRIERAYLLMFSRPASTAEQAAGKEYLARVRDKLAGVPAEQQTRKAMESFVRVLFMSNEFVYVN